VHRFDSCQPCLEQMSGLHIGARSSELHSDIALHTGSVAEFRELKLFDRFMVIKVVKIVNTSSSLSD
jgi:hypothetical protein